MWRYTELSRLNRNGKLEGTNGFHETTVGQAGRNEYANRRTPGL